MTGSKYHEEKIVLEYWRSRHEQKEREEEASEWLLRRAQDLHMRWGSVIGEDKGIGDTIGMVMEEHVEVVPVPQLIALPFSR